MSFHFQQVIIITNSDDGWVKFSCARFLPDLLPELDNFRIVSARTLYERFYPGQPLCWKAAAFAHEVSEMYEAHSQGSSSELSLESTDVSSLDTSYSETDEATSDFSAPLSGSKEIVSFGDSLEEKMAVRIVADQLTATPKSVMFIQLPTPVQILGQLHMVIQHMGFVCQNASSLDLQISPEEAEHFANLYLRKRRLGTSDYYRR